MCGVEAEKKVGMVAARDFNTIQIVNDQLVKSSKRDSILGELFFYSHMPADVRPYFRSAHSLDFIAETSAFTTEMERCPVFSNAILSPKETSVKFIDVRCRLGNVLTAAGDVNHDLAKVLQSLCGYDHILLLSETSVRGPVNIAEGRARVLPEPDAALLATLREHFFDRVRQTYPVCPARKILYGLAATLFLTLIPLHKPEVRRVFMRLCEDAMDKAAVDGPDN